MTRATTRPGGGGVTRAATRPGGGGVTRAATRPGGAAPHRRPILGGAVSGRRSAAAALALAAVLAVWMAAPARAGTFRVSQCNAVEAAGLSPRGYQASLWSFGDGWAAPSCGAQDGSIRIGSAARWLPARWDMTTRFSLPASMPGTTMQALWLDWRFPSQAADGTNSAHLFATAGRAPLFLAEPGEGTPASGAVRHELPPGTRDLELMVWCSPAGGAGWCSWPDHLLEVRGLTAELEENGVPSATASGPLLASGLHGGIESLQVAASDGDSGVRRVVVELGGIAVGSAEPAEGCRDDRLPACEQSSNGTVHVDTRAVPDGSHPLRLIVTDAAGNVRVVEAGTVRVHNPPPSTEIPPGGGTPGTGGPGPGSGQGAPVAPPFPPNPLAGRGHVPNGTNASERARLDAWLEPPRLRGGSPGAARRGTVTVPTGVRVRVRGLLTDESGRPIGRAALAAIRREPGGSWTAVTGLRTRPNGRFTTFARIGPPQALRFVYYAHGDSRRGRRSRALHVRVRSR